MPRDLTRDVIARSLSGHEGSVGNEGGRRGTLQRAGETARLFVGHACIMVRDIAARAWSNGPRALSMARAMTMLIWLAVLILCVYVGLAAMLYVSQRTLMYFPETIHTTPEQAGLPEAEEMTLPTADGEHVIAWHVPPRDGKPVI